MDTILNPPSHLSPESKAFWHDIVKDYDFSGDIAGQKILRVALESFDRSQAAREQISKDGMTILDKFSQIKQHPLISCERDSRAGFLAGLKQLGLERDADQKKPVGRPSSWDRAKAGRGW